jgi:hypothetical protein
MPTYGAERAVILPQLQNATEPGWRFVENLQQNQRVAEEKRRYEQHRQDQMLEWALDQMDFKNFATGTVLDPTIHQSLDGAMKSVTQKIMQGGYGNNAEMMYDVKNSVSDVANYSTKAKNIRAVIDENVKALSKNPAIDPAKLRKWAYAGAFLKYDPQGNVVGVKPTQEIDDSADYVNDLIQNAPEKIYTGAQALYEALPKLNNEEVGKVYKRRDKSGKLTDTEYSGKLYEHQELYEDPETGEYRSRVKGKDVTFSDGTKGRGLSDDAYNRIFGSGDNQIVLNAEFNKRFKDAIQSGEIKREDVPALKSAFALQMVENSKVGGIKNKDIVQERMPSIRNYTNVNMPGAGSGVAVNDIFSHINTMADERRPDGRYLQVNLLRPDAQKYVVDLANSISSLTKEEDGEEKKVPFSQKDIYIQKSGIGVGVYNAHTKKLITVLDPLSTNVNVQPGIKEERAVVEQNRNTRGGVQSTGNTSGLKQSYSAGGKTFSLKQLRDMGYTDAQIQQAVKLGNLK